MPLVSGTKLGPYEVVGPLGTGGMGEVYRARDKRLERTVAIKILPAQFSADLVRKQRFEREAKTISALNHPNICTLYDIGSQDGVDYLVMECVEGDTLAKRLEKGPLPLEQVLKYGAQIANALDKAHRAGIVHRDLKPGNIMITPTGSKLLDFGLAKPAAAAVSGMTITSAATQTSPVTQEGTIVGTFQYMSPEQIEGKDVDGRSDIFSLGAVLYEMLTGKKAFEGKSQLSVASAILEREPVPIGSVKPMTPPALDHAIRRCVAKDPEERWQAVRDLKRELEWIAGAPAEATNAQAAASHHGFLPWVAAGALALIAASSSWIAFRSTRPPELKPLVRLEVDLGHDVLLGAIGGSDVIISPDGERIAFLSRGHLFTRRLDQPSATEIAITQGATSPFFSPDGQWISFTANAKLRKVFVEGGAEVVCATLDRLTPAMIGARTAPLCWLGQTPDCSEFPPPAVLPSPSLSCREKNGRTAGLKSCPAEK